MGNRTRYVLASTQRKPRHMPDPRIDNRHPRRLVQFIAVRGRVGPRQLALFLNDAHAAAPAARGEPGTPPAVAESAAAALEDEKRQAQRRAAAEIEEAEHRVALQRRELAEARDAAMLQHAA